MTAVSWSLKGCPRAHNEFFVLITMSPYWLCLAGAGLTLGTAKPGLGGAAATGLGGAAATGLGGKFPYLTGCKPHS